MIMKRIYFAYAIASLAVLLGAGCTNDNAGIEFGIDTDTFTIDEFGGTRSIRISSDTEWIATSDDPWLTISPANGRGSAECRIIIDSALTNYARTGHVRITQQNESLSNREITIEQQGFDYQIALGLDNDREEVEISNYAGYGQRYFDLTVKTNVDFDVEIPAEARSWLNCDNYTVTLNRGLRPREVKLRFNWGINSMPLERRINVTFKPKKQVEMSRQDVLTVRQSAAEPIEEGTRNGDSVALLGVYRSLGVWSGQWDTSKPMDTWTGVSLWREGQEGYTPEKEGRVRSAYFFLFETRDGIPYEVQYLTAAESLRFFSNVNSFLYSLDPGEYITKLTQLKRLSISAYGLTTLPDELANLKNLEYLDLSANNFQSIPSVISPENFPKLRVLYMNANRRAEFSDLSNAITPTYGDIGGFLEEENVLERLFRFKNLDSLTLSINYLHGHIPSFDDGVYADDPEFTWTRENADTLATQMTAHHLWEPVDDGTGQMKRIPRVMPNLKWFAINGNRFTGDIPLWLLYHPHLDEWIPFQLVFAQEGRTTKGELAGFANEPVNLEYYYDFYEGAKTRPSDDYYADDGR